jgi:hypothetical protein
MKYSLFAPIILLGLFSIVSCKGSDERTLVGEWQEVAVINPQLDEAVNKQQLFADTVGSKTTAAQNKALYGTDNIEEMRKSLKTNLDSFRKAQHSAINATRFVFRADGLLYTHSLDGVDSSNWYLDDDGALILDEGKLKGTGNRIRMEIAELSDTLLKLQYNEQFLTSTAVFKPVKK